VIPYYAHFGSFDEKYFIWPENELNSDNINTYVGELNDNLSIIRDISREFQLGLIEKRVKDNNLEFFKPGSLVLKINDEQFKKFKISTKYLGPLEVVSQHKNDVVCVHLSSGREHVFHISKLKYYIGSKEEAIKIAAYDDFEFKIVAILDFKGQPLKRTEMAFKVEFEDKSKEWLNYNLVKNTIFFEKFCEDKPFLKILLLSTKEANKQINLARSNKITGIKGGSVLFVDLRSFDNNDWFHNLDLPNIESINYFLQFEVLQFENKSETRISVFCKLLKQTFKVDNFWIESCSKLKLEKNDFLVNEKFAKKFPSILSEKGGNVTLP
jgi:hypothetical protein